MSSRCLVASLTRSIAAVITCCCLPPSLVAADELTSVRPRAGFNPVFEELAGTVNTIVVAPDGKVYVGGDFTRFAVLSAGPLARLLPDGNLDPTFTSAVTGGTVTDLAVQADGKLLVVGNPLVGDVRRTMLRLNSDGTLDASFNPTLSGGGINALAVQSDGKIVIGGFFQTVNLVSRSRIARLNADGSTDASFDPGSGADGLVNVIAIHPDGSIFAGGYFSVVDGLSRTNAVRFGPSGTVDPVFNSGSGFINSVDALAIDADGRVIAASASQVTRFHANGLLDTSFAIPNGALNGGVLAVLPLPNGQYLVAGRFARIAYSAAVDTVARLNADGSIDDQFQYALLNQTSPVAANAIAVQPDARILVGYHFQYNVNTTSFARFQSNGERDLTYTPEVRRAASVQRVIPTAGGKWIAIGGFHYVDNTPRSGIARIHADGQHDVTFAPDPAATPAPNAVASQPDGRIVMGGTFTSYNGSPVGRIVRLRNDGSRDPTFNTGTGFGSDVTSLVLLPDAKVVVAGEFQSFNGVTRRNLARLQPDGSLDESFDSGSGLTGSGQPVSPRIALRHDGRLIVLGTFSNYNGAGRENLAQVLPDGANDPSFTPAFELSSNRFFYLQPLADGRLLLGTVSFGFGAPPSGYLTCLLPEGTVDATFSAQSSGLGQILGRPGPEQANGKVFVPSAGNPTLPGRNFVRLNSTGSVDPTFALPIGVSVSSAAFDASGNLVIAGPWSQFSNFSGHGLVVLEPDGVPSITSPLVQSVLKKVPFNYPITASDSPTSFNATGLPEGLSINTTTGAITGVPTTTGLFAVTLTATNASGTGGATLSLTIAKTPASITLGPTTFAFDGAPHPVDLTTDPAGLATVVTYDGSTTVPTEPGSYALEATIDDSDHEGSAAATLHILPPIQPVQTGPVETVAGSGTVLSVTYDGSDDTAYQWQFETMVNGPTAGSRPFATIWTDIPGATESSLNLASTQRFHGGTYRVIVTEHGLAQTSAPFVVNVAAAAPNDARLLNLSTRAQAQTGDNILIPGFVVGGTGTKQLLIRAVGPTLTHHPYNIATALNNPRMALKRLDFSVNPPVYVDIGENDDWQTNTNATAVAQAMTDLFAFPFEDDREAALLVDLIPGQYTVFADGVNAATGIAIVELYDADGSSPTATLINISNRGFVGTGDNVMIPGFVVSQEGPKTLLIRVVGPTLGGPPYNVPGTMADPKLEIFPQGGNTPILANDNWGDNPDAGNTAQTAINVSAFELASGSADAAFVVTLQPGAYTVVGSAADGTSTGVVLVEIYVVP